MTKNMILFITVIMIIFAGVMSVSGAPLKITAPSDIMQDATSSLTTHVDNLGTATVKGKIPAGMQITNDAPPDDNFPLGVTNVVWTIGNDAATGTAIQVVTIRDMTGPTITMVGSSIATINVGTAYVDEGATAVDIVDGDVTAKIKTVSNVDTSVAGNYSVTYDVADNAGNPAEQKIRTVNVIALQIADTIPPTIVLPSNITLQATGVTTHVNLVTPVVTDNVDTSPTITNDALTGDNFPIGNTVVTWKACDHTTPTPNCNVASQLVTIVDTTSPTIVPPPDVNIGATGSVTYVTLGNATASDLVDPSPIISNYAPVGNNFPVGDTKVVWKACDNSGNCNTTTQLVTIQQQGASLITYNPPLSISETAPSTVEFNITTDKAVNVTWSLDGVNIADNNSVTYASYVNTINTIGNYAVVAHIENGNGSSSSESWIWNVKGELEISANVSSVLVGQPTDVAFTVTRKCGIESSDNSSCIDTDIPVVGANIYLTGVSSGNGITDVSGKAMISVNTTGVGIITATASYSSGYNDNTTSITSDNISDVPSSSNSVGGSSIGNGGGGSGGDSGGSSGGSSGGGGGGGGSAEPYGNILKYEIQEHDVLTTPVSFAYDTPELGIYNVWVTSTQNGIAALRIEVLKDTSQLVGYPAEGIVYKNINAWMDYKRIKNATMEFKVENSWIDSNGLSADEIKMSQWDNDSGKWIELPTTMISKDDAYAYFESQTETFSSFAISGMKAASVAADAADVNAAVDGVSLPSATVMKGPVPNSTTTVASKGSTKSLQIGIVAILTVMIFYVIRLKKS